MDKQLILNTKAGMRIFRNTIPGFIYVHLYLILIVIIMKMLIYCSTKLVQ